MSDDQNNQGPDIASMFPQISLTAPSQPEEPQPSLEEVTEQPQQMGEQITETAMQQQAAMRAQLMNAALEAMENTMEVNLACAMARVAFLGVASQEDEPKSLVTQTISNWVKSEKEKYQNAPAELKIAVWEKLEAYASAQEQHLLSLLEQS